MIPVSIRAATAAGLWLAVAATVSQAQVPVPPRDPNMPAPQNIVPDKIEGQRSDSTGSTNTLSDKLERSDGVIAPPDPGAGRIVTPPDTGTMPVIPPAATPQGAQPDRGAK